VEQATSPPNAYMYVQNSEAGHLAPIDIFSENVVYSKHLKSNRCT